MTKLELIKAAVLAIKTIYTEFKATKAITDQVVPMKWKKTKYAVAGVSLFITTSVLSFWAEYQKYEDVEMGVQKLALVSPLSASEMGRFTASAEISLDSARACGLPVFEFIGGDMNNPSTLDGIIYLGANLACPALGLTSDEKFDKKYEYLERMNMID